MSENNDSVDKSESTADFAEEFVKNMKLDAFYNITLKNVEKIADLWLKSDIEKRKEIENKIYKIMTSRYDSTTSMDLSDMFFVYALLKEKEKSQESFEKTLYRIAEMDTESTWSYHILYKLFSTYGYRTSLETGFKTLAKLCISCASHPDIIATSDILRSLVKKCTFKNGDCDEWETYNRKIDKLASVMKNMMFDSALKQISDENNIRTCHILSTYLLCMLSENRDSETGTRTENHLSLTEHDAEKCADKMLSKIPAENLACMLAYMLDRNPFADESRTLQYIGVSDNKNIGLFFNSRIINMCVKELASKFIHSTVNDEHHFFGFSELHNGFNVAARITGVLCEEIKNMALCDMSTTGVEDLVNTAKFGFCSKTDILMSVVQTLKEINGGNVYKQCKDDVDSVNNTIVLMSLKKHMDYGESSAYDTSLEYI